MTIAQIVVQVHQLFATVGVQVHQLFALVLAKTGA